MLIAYKAAANIAYIKAVLDIFFICIPSPLN